jgi:hypothetical protein
MNIQNRLKKLEQNSLTIETETTDCEAKPCEHPPSMFNLRRDYPAKGCLDRRLVTKGHCDNCGFDDYLWSFYNLTEEQENRRYELRHHSSEYYASDAYDLELIAAGLIKYALYPLPAEVQIRFTGRERK